MHKERDTSLQRSYSRGDLLASLTRRKVTTYRAPTCIRSEILAYSGLIREVIF